MATQDSRPAKPKVFIGSSSLGLKTARDIQNKLIDATEPTVWKDEDWFLKGTLEQLMNILNKYNFGIFILRPDDSAEIKGETMKVTRDNVLLELGLFIGRHGRERTFIVSQDDKDLRIASDLLGINFAQYSADSESQLTVACNNIRDKIEVMWARDKEQATADTEINPLTYEAGMLYRILNAASSPHYKPIDYSYLMKPYTPVGEQSLARIAEVRRVAERLFYYYMLADLKTAKSRSQNLRVYFAYYLGDGAPLSEGSEPFFCFGRDNKDKRFKGEFVIGISTSEGSEDPRWNSGLPLGGYDKGLLGRALSNAAAAFREVASLPIDDTDNPPREYKHLNFKVDNERAVYSVPVLLSEIMTGQESVAPIGVLTISGSDPHMITDNIKKRADHLAILLGFIFYLHSKQNRDEALVHEDVGVSKIPIGFSRGTNKDFMRSAVSLRREIAKHFEKYFIRESIHKFESDELFYVPSQSEVEARG